MSIKKQFAMVAAMMGIAAQSYGKESPYDMMEHPHYSPAPRKHKSRDEELADKGLQEYVINGEKILAHNEREAQKRYKSRHK